MAGAQRLLLAVVCIHKKGEGGYSWCSRSWRTVTRQLPWDMWSLLQLLCFTLCFRLSLHKSSSEESSVGQYTSSDLVLFALLKTIVSCDLSHCFQSPWNSLIYLPTPGFSLSQKRCSFLICKDDCTSISLVNSISLGIVSLASWTDKVGRERLVSSSQFWRCSTVPANVRSKPPCSSPSTLKKCLIDRAISSEPFLFCCFILSSSSNFKYG